MKNAQNHMLKSLTLQHGQPDTPESVAPSDPAPALVLRPELPNLVLERGPKLVL